MKMTDEILLTLQKSFPLVARPFEAIAMQLNTTEQKVIETIKLQKKNHIIRQTSAIFDTKSLGYNSSLVAFEIKPQHIDDAVKILNCHPGITHNYERNHSFNIWFTIATSPQSVIGLEKTVKILAKLTKAEDYIVLPTLKLFKISVKLDTTGKEATKQKVVKQKKVAITLNDRHIELIKLLQEDIDISPEPFGHITKKLNMSYDDMFAMVDELKLSGVMRRFASILNHRKAGFNANAMVVWDIDETQAETYGETAAQYNAVSHCYLRPKYPRWRYNLFTMIHGKTKDDTQKVIDSIKNEIKAEDYMPLYSSREFKKIRLKYYADEEKLWEKEYL